MTGVSSARTVSILKDLEVTHIVTIPDGESRHLFAALTDEPEITVISPTREGEGLAIAAGLWVGGCKPLVLLQNTGLMEAGDALRGCGIGPSIPLMLLVGWRGYPGAMAGKLPLDSAYPFTEPLLDAWEVPHWRLMTDDDLPAIAEMDRVASATSKPAAVVFGHAFLP
ncbi:MAG TPA: thiamine pyrophosphate-binding protein [Acidimicrobiia bacterium]|nr:thiamine pyrophosphate-binding protein [Acidimicrobiia bacterium]